MKRKAIFVIGLWSRVGGLEIVTQDYVNVFRGLGFDVTVFSAIGQGEDICEPHFAVKHLEPKNRILKSLWHRFFMRRLIGRKVSQSLENGDVLVFGHARLLPVLRFAQVPKGVVCWVWTHGVDAWGNIVGQWTMWQDHLSRIIAVSSYTADEERKNGITRPISLIPNSVNVERFTPSQTPERIRRDEILISSRLTPNTRNKGHDVLFAAVPLIEKKLGRQVRVKVIGTGSDLAHVKDLAEKMCPGRVEFLGRVSDEALMDSYRHCACFCMPSRVEYHPETKDYRGDGFGLVYAEAQACGRPVVGSIEGGAVDPIEEGVTGYKVNPRSAEAVADAVVKLLSDPEKADAMGRAGREFVVRRFSSTAFKNRIREVLKEDGIEA